MPARRDSNPRHLGPKPSALSPELRADGGGTSPVSAARRGRVNRLDGALTRVEDVSERVAEQVEAVDGEGDGEARPKGHPWGCAEVVAAGAGEHAAPRWSWRRGRRAPGNSGTLPAQPLRPRRWWRSPGTARRNAAGRGEARSGGCRRQQCAPRPRNSALDTASAWLRTTRAARGACTSAMARMTLAVDVPSTAHDAKRQH